MPAARWLMVLLLGAFGSTAGFSADAPQRPPNVLILFADDLGYSDLGCYGSEIETPHLDALAAGGLRFTQFYNTARCWPSRAALLTGYYAQQVRRDTLPGIPSGSRGVRPSWAPLLPALLQPAGYRAYHSGKWHVDGPRLPSGFEHSYSLEDHDRLFAPQQQLLDDVVLPPTPRDRPKYVTTTIADHAVECLQRHARQHPQAPFCSYVAFTVPHFPLKAHPEEIAKYRDRYRAGWDQIRQQRHARQLQMGLVSGALSAAEVDVGPPYDFPEAIAKLGPDEINRPLPWSQLTAGQQEFQASKMAIHAAMVDRMDQEIGKILQQVDTMGARENTLVVFLSDNGASAEMMVRGDGHDPSAPAGSEASYLCLGPGWSTAANTPFRRHKTWVHEGGIATPFIATWPRGIAARGELRTTPAHVIDLVPTLLELAGVTATNPKGPPRPGRSLVPAFTAAESTLHEDLWWLHEGNRAIRQGEWKLVAAGEQGAWELYHIHEDRAEQHNLAAQYPERVAELSRLWSQRLEQFRNDALSEPAPELPPRRKNQK